MVSFVKTKMNLATVDQSEDKRLQEKDKFFKEGIYDAIISEAVESKQPSKDPRWKSINLTLEASGDKKTYATIEVPLEDTDYIVNGKNWFFKFNDFRAFAVGIGMQDDDDMLAFITNRILDMPKLKGQPVKIKMGWQKGVHPKYVNENTFHLVDEKDAPLLADGNPMKFPNRDACEVYAKQKNLIYRAWVRPISFIEPEKKAKEEVKPVEKKKKVVDMPF
jgi:hypothetical protein